MNRHDRKMLGSCVRKKRYTKETAEKVTQRFGNYYYLCKYCNGYHTSNQKEPGPKTSHEPTKTLPRSYKTP